MAVLVCLCGLGCPHIMVAELSSYNRDRMAYKA